MTIDELERDLRAVAEPQPHDERLRLAVRTTLGHQLQARPRRTRRTRLAFGSAVAVAASAAAAVALIGPGGSGGPSAANAAILRHATRALNPPADLIVHVKEVGTQDGTPVGVEWWQETNPPYAFRLSKWSGHYRGGGSGEGNVIDPIESARAQLARGTAEVAGTTTIDGRSLYKIALPDGSFVYFDKTDYQPMYVDNRQRDDGSMVRTRVVTYEELPLTAENRRLLVSSSSRGRSSRR